MLTDFNLRLILWRQIFTTEVHPFPRVAGVSCKEASSGVDSCTHFRKRVERFRVKHLGGRSGHSYLAKRPGCHAE